MKAPTHKEFLVRGPSVAAVISAPPEDYVTRILKTGRYYEAELLDAIRALGAEGTFVDVGACFGNHTAYFALECGAERVVAIESSPDNFAQLDRTVARNGLTDRVTAHHLAIHDTWESAALLDAPDGNAGMTSVREGGPLATAQLDDLLAGISRVGLLKVDTEGQSLSVLRSGIKTLATQRPALAIETIDLAEEEAVFRLLDALGYGRPERRYCATPVWLWRGRWG